MARQKFYRRQFLNSEEHGGTAFVEASVCNSDKTYIAAEFKIADCNRIVNLDYSVWNASDAAHIREKLKKMRLAFRAFETALLKEIDTHY